LSGQWRGHVHPSRANGISAGLETSVEIVLTIRQTWTEIVITAQTDLSKSHSLSDHLIIADEITVSYEYVNEPFAHAPRTMHVHRGTARLDVTNRGSILDGEYYSGRDRQNVGTIRVMKV